MKKRISKDDIVRVEAVLKHSFKVFDRAHPVPLAIGIRREIREEIKIPSRMLNVFLHRWTRSESYLKALVEPNAMRRHADGSVQGKVEPRHRLMAAELLGFGAVSH